MPTRDELTSAAAKAIETAYVEQRGEISFWGTAQAAVDAVLALHPLAAEPGVAVPEPDEPVILPCGCGDVRRVYVQHGRGCKLCDECGGIYPDCDCRPAASPVAQEDQEQQ